MPKYLSGRVKRTPQGSLTTDRYQYLGLDQAEPNLGDPANPLPNPPGGSQFQIISLREYPGQRFWIPLTGGIQPGSITVREEGTVVPPSGINSTTDINFKGAAITVTGYTEDNGNPGTAVTVTVAPPGDDHGVLFNNAGEFATSPYFTFDNTTGIGSVGIGTTAPTQNLHVVGNVKLDKTIYGEDNEPGSTGDLLVKTATGGVVWTNQNSVEAGAGGTIGQIQFHGSTGLIDGADKFYYDFNNDRVGIGSTIPDRLLDVLGNSRFTGVTTFVGFTTFTDDVTFTTANVKNIFFDKSDDSLKFGDNVKAKFGDSGDLEIYHNGNHSYISDTGTGNLRLIGNGNVDIMNAEATEYKGRFITNGAVELYYDNVKRLATSGVGASVYGQLDAYDVYASGVGNTAVVSIGKTDNLRLLHNSTNGIIENNYGELILDGKGGGAIVFKTSVSQIERLRIHNDGKVQINGDDVSNIFSGANDLIVGETTQSSEKGITIANNSTGSIRFNDGSDAGIIDYVHPYDLMKFSAGGTEGFRIDGSGNVKITGIATVGAALTVGSNLEVNGNILPKTHKGGNIGESGSFSWNKIYADEFIGQIQTTQENLEVNQLKVTGVSTFVGIATFGNGIHVQSGVSTFSESVGILTNLFVTGIITSKNIHFNNNALIANIGSPSQGLSGNNIDHIWHQDDNQYGYGTGGVWNFVSDSTYKAAGNSAIQIGYLMSSRGGHLLGNVGIGTTDPNAAVTSSNTVKLAVGIVTTNSSFTQDLNVSGVSTFSDDVEFHGTSGISSITFDKSDDSLKFIANAKLKFGNSADFQIYHGQSPFDPTSADQHSYIQDTGTGDLVILSNEVAIRNAGETEDMARFFEGGRVELRYDGSRKFETSGVGVTVTGLTDTDTLLVSGISTLSGEVGIGSNLLVSGISTFNNDVFFNGSSGITSIRFDHDAGSLKFVTRAKAVFGADGGNTKDLEIYSTESHSYIKHENSTDGSHLYIQSSDNLILEHTDGNNWIRGVNDGATELYWNATGTKRLATSANGIDVTGNLLRTGTGQDIGASSAPWDKIYANEFIGEVNTTQENLITQQLKVTGLSTFMDDARFEQDVLILGTLTYDDVTNIDSIGIITARSGIDNNGGLQIAGITTIVAGAFNDNVTTGGRSYQTNVDIQSTSLRSGVVVRNSFDFRTDNTNNAGFMVLDPYTNAAKTFAFRAAEGATLTDTFWVKTNGDGYFSGSVGIGLSDPDSTLETVSPATDGINAHIGGLYNDGGQAAVRRIEFGTKNYRNSIQSQQGSGGDNFSSDNDLLLNPSGGNIGIGINDPDGDILNVGFGTARFAGRGDLIFKGDQLIDGRNPAVRLGSPNNAANVEVDLLFHADNGEHPRIASRRLIGDGDSARIEFTSSGTYARKAITFWTKSAASYSDDPEQRLRITPTGEVNIGGNYTQTTYKMRVTGTVAATHFDSLSDLKLKTNVKQIQNPIETVKKIDGVTFNWKEDNDPSMGVIAQNVEKILPEIVSGEDIKSVNYSGLIGLLIETVKDQQKQIDELRGLIDK